MTLFEEVVAAVESRDVVSKLTYICSSSYLIISWQGIPQLHRGRSDTVDLDFVAQRALQAPVFAANSNASLQERIAADNLWLLINELYSITEIEIARSHILFNLFVIARRSQPGVQLLENTKKHFTDIQNSKIRKNIFSFTPQQFKELFGDIAPLGSTFRPVKRWFSFGKVDPESERWLASREMLEDVLTAAAYKRSVTLEQPYICISKDPKSQIDLIVTVITTSTKLHSLELSINMSVQSFANILDAIKQSSIKWLRIGNDGSVINSENLLKLYWLIKESKTITIFTIRYCQISETFRLFIDAVAKSASLQKIEFDNVQFSQENVNMWAKNMASLYKLTRIELIDCKVNVALARSLVAAIYQFPFCQTWLYVSRQSFDTELEANIFNDSSARVAASQTARQARHAMLALAIRNNTAENSTDTTPQPITPAYNFMSRDGDTAVRTRVLRMMLEPEDTSLVTENPWLASQDYPWARTRGAQAYSP